MGSKIGIGLAEMPVPKPISPVRAERGRVSAAQHEMPGRINQAFLFLGIAPPEQKHYSVSILRDPSDDLVGEHLPAPVLVGGRLAFTNRQRGIEQKHSLIRPMGQVSILRIGPSKICFQLLEDIYQRRRVSDSLMHGKTQSIGLSCTVIGILAEYDHLDGLERTMVKGRKNLPSRGIAPVAFVFRTHKLRQIREIVLAELGFEPGFPTG